MMGLQAVFHSIFPIFDFNKTVSLEFVSYTLEAPKYSEKECRDRGLSYEAPLKVTVRLVFYEQNEDGEESKTVSSIKEQEVYLGNIPLMTYTGSFIYNGTERVIVSQLHIDLLGSFLNMTVGRNTQVVNFFTLQELFLIEVLG
jgi:DNA-directed RNA polymerase subunit beta